VRDAADAERIRSLARELGRAVAPGTKMYLTGGATAVLEGWRKSTVDIDVRFEPDSDAALNRIGEIKERLAVDMELASPLDFLPPLDGWRERSIFRFREGNLEVFDFAAAAVRRNRGRAVSVPGGRPRQLAGRSRVAQPRLERSCTSQRKARSLATP
jgi:hypothetical protein